MSGTAVSRSSNQSAIHLVWVQGQRSHQIHCPGAAVNQHPVPSSTDNSGCARSMAILKKGCKSVSSSMLSSGSMPGTPVRRMSWNACRERSGADPEWWHRFSAWRPIFGLLPAISSNIPRAGARNNRISVSRRSLTRQHDWISLTNRSESMAARNQIAN